MQTRAVKCALSVQSGSSPANFSTHACATRSSPTPAIPPSPTAKRTRWPLGSRLSTSAGTVPCTSPSTQARAAAAEHAPVVKPVRLPFCEGIDVDTDSVTLCIKRILNDKTAYCVSHLAPSHMLSGSQKQCIFIWLITLAYSCSTAKKSSSNCSSVKAVMKSDTSTPLNFSKNTCLSSFSP